MPCYVEFVMALVKDMPADGFAGGYSRIDFWPIRQATVEDLERLGADSDPERFIWVDEDEKVVIVRL